MSRGPITAPLLDAEQAAARLGLHRAETVRELARRGELGHVRVGRLVRFTEADLAEYVARHHHPPRAPGALRGPAPIPGVVPPNPRARRYGR